MCGGPDDEGNDGGDILGSQDGRELGRGELLGTLGEQRRVDLSRMKGAGADPVHAFLDIDAVGEGGQAMLGRRIHRAAEGSDRAACDGRDDDEQAVAARPHQGKGGGDRVHLVAQIAVEQGVHVACRQFGPHPCLDVDPGGTDDAIEAPMTGLDGGRYQNPQLSADLASCGVSHETALAVVEQVEIAAKYAGYIDRQRDEVGRAAHFENMPLPADLDYGQVSALSMEVRQKLNRHKPETLGQASRISGVTPAAISLLLIHLRRGRFSGFAPEPAEAAP